MIDLNPRDSALMALARGASLPTIQPAPCICSQRRQDWPALASRKVRPARRPKTTSTKIGRYVYAGDTALHVAAGAHRTDVVQKLMAMGADVRARNRRGAEPLHAAAVGMPGSQAWNPSAQAATIAFLIRAGADLNAADNSGVTALHRAVRTRCAAAVEALLAGGPVPGARTRAAQRPCGLRQRTPRGGSGSPEAKAQQQWEIQRLLKQHGSTGQ